MAKTYGKLPSAVLGLRSGSWEAYQLDRTCLTLADRVDAAVNDAAERSARSRHGDGGRGIEAAMLRVLDPPKPRVVPAGPMVVYDLSPEGEVSWRYEHEPAPEGSTPLSEAA